MINIEQAVTDKFPAFSHQPALIRKPTLTLLRKLTHEREINDFLDHHRNIESFEFIDSVFDYFNFSYAVSASDRDNIPAQGRLVVIANHPIGSLDGLAILRLVGEVRRDVKIVANDMLMNFRALQSLLVPLDNMNGGGARRSYRAVQEALEREEAVIIFPAGEVSRARPTGVRDTRWRPGFLHFARRAGAPILPIHIGAKNSLLFYSASMLFKPLGTALLAREMFNKQSHVIRFRIGEPIPSSALRSDQLHDKALLKRLRKHLYKVGKRHRPIFVTEKTIAHPEDRRELQRELKSAKLLGETRDQNGIYLADYRNDSPLIREIGRLREVAFRKVGEGTGARRDLDRYDRHYRHLVLWDRDTLELAGAYRLGEMGKLLTRQGEDGLYIRSLYRFQPEFRGYLEHGLELGRSFVNPLYWGKASLDYLWQGIGAYLRHHPEVRYLIGPVSMSADYPRELIDPLVFHYQNHYACAETLVKANQPYTMTPASARAIAAKYGHLDREAAFALLQTTFQEAGQKLPVLFKQYAALFESGGFQLLAFSVDPDFGDCLDGLFLADLTKLKPAKRKRYLGI
ncbi:GNAT family N-acetyltransferase [Exilibacterium tricleocarpae]|uniref:L-ornithine N(alpha)-acyltransferase n=1 Tax=Exilibacterium tricleocarpae TaxID=2591008 RepID=A0A545T3Q4_9GAMM|nr:lysophospholipid acyltransferase family protein [Exilibacterium tricleocarpae]TQV71847.1 GNAT family N-acetyltransferase [Exilibacterium tricleocarpae]